MKIIKSRKVVKEAKCTAYESKFGTNDGEKNIYKLAKIREMKTRYLNSFKCFKDEDQISKSVSKRWAH